VYGTTYYDLVTMTAASVYCKLVAVRLNSNCE